MSTKTDYKYKRVDPNLDPQVVDVGSQWGWTGDQRSAMGQDLYNRIMNLGQSGGGGGGGRGGGGPGRLYTDLKALSYDDPTYQQELRRATRGSDARTSDQLQGVEDLGARMGAGGGGLQSAYADTARQGAQSKAELLMDKESGMRHDIQGRDDLIAQIQASMDNTYTSGKFGLASAHASAAPGMAMAGLARQRMPFDIMGQFMSPYAVNFPKAEYLTTQTNAKTPWWETALNAAAGVGAAYAGRG